MRFQSPKTPSFNQFEINAATLCQVLQSQATDPLYIIAGIRLVFTTVAVIGS
jgi:hypothetical protein